MKSKKPVPLSTEKKPRLSFLEKMAATLASPVLFRIAKLGGDNRSYMAMLKEVWRKG